MAASVDKKAFLMTLILHEDLRTTHDILDFHLNHFPARHDVQVQFCLWKGFRSGRPAPMVARVPDPPHDPEIPPRDRHQWSPRHESPCVHPRVRFATTLGPVAVIGPWLGLARSFLEFLVVSWSDLLSLSSSPDRRSWDSPPARGSASGQSRNPAFSCCCCCIEQNKIG